MVNINIVTERELTAVIDLDLSVVDCIESAFRALAGGRVVMPPILRLDIEAFKGEVDVKTAYVPGIESFAIKISPGFFDNPKLGLPSVNGLMVLCSAKTGIVEAVLLDNGFLTDVRTAAAGAVAARHLARTNAHRVTILGAGMQACLQLQALTLVKDIHAAVIWARDHDKAIKTAKHLSAKLGIPVVAENDAALAVASADIVVTTTPANQPILMADWLRPGQHVTTMGSDAKAKNELEPAAIAKADLYVADSRDQVARLGELHHAIALGIVGNDFHVPELGQIISGAALGRTDHDQLTICDLTGTGVQDTAIAALAKHRLSKSSAGTIINN